MRIHKDYDGSITVDGEGATILVQPGEEDEIKISGEFDPTDFLVTGFIFKGANTD